VQTLSCVGAAKMKPRMLEATVRLLCNQPWDTLDITLEQLQAHSARCLSQARIMNPVRVRTHLHGGQTLTGHSSCPI